jgi:prepilin-type N-terminal cleavage/methylation domain-containing protein/prepilin-type processing-associated H-X9-DG protein
MSAPTKTPSAASKMVSRADGFTMIEILTVVAIIAVLALVGFPALTRALETANNGKCKANLKTLASACLAYAADNNGYLPANGPVSEGGTNGTRHVTAWSRYKPEGALHHQMAPYGLGSPNKAWACLCPSDKNALTMRPGSLTSYAIPGPLSPGSRDCGPDGKHRTGPWPRIHQLNNPGRVIMLFEYFGNHYGDPPGSQCIKVGANPPATLNVAFLDGSVGTYKQDTNAPWMHLEYHWRTPPDTPLSERVHVLQR